MSTKRGYKDWLAKYFATRPSKQMMWEEAVAHCIRKWSGAHPLILAKYDATKGWGSEIYFETSKKSFHFKSENCALCVKTGLEQKDCKRCPLYHVRGQVECTAMAAVDWDYSPCDAFTRDSNILPMLIWLRKTKRFLKTKKWREIQDEFKSRKKNHKGVVR